MMERFGVTGPPRASIHFEMMRQPPMPRCCFLNEAGTELIQVQQDRFVISLELKGGELEAEEAESIVAPRVHGQLKIVDLFPEGEQAEVGDLLVQVNIEVPKMITPKVEALLRQLAEEELVDVTPHRKS